MKKQSTILILLIVCIGFILTSCGSDNSELEAALAAKDARFTVNAGDDQSVELNDTVQLSANKCFDLDGNPLNYLWEFVLTPNGSTAGLSAPDIEGPTFNADIVGVYKISLTINNGIESKGDEVEITVNDNSGTNPGTNTTPVADAGVNQAITIGDTVTLDGTGSYDPDIGNTITYSWAFVTRPPLSTAVLSNSTSAEPTFIPDNAGSYEISLTVNDGEDSNTDTVIVTASSGTVTTPGIEVNDRLNNSITNGTTFYYNSININNSYGEEFTIQNNGTADLVISDISFISGNQSDFNLNTTSTSMTLQPNNSTTFIATFQPNSGGTRSAVIRIQNNASTIDFTLQGYSITTADIEIRNATNTVISNGSSFNYGNRNVYTNTPAKFNIFNSGTANLSISSASLISGDTGDFTVDTSEMNSPVLPNGSTSFSIMFNPTVGGTKSATVRISNNAETRDFIVTGFAFDYSGKRSLDSLNDVGMYSSINVENEIVYICYYDETNRRVRFARSYTAGIDWSTETIPCTMDVGKGSSMVVDGNYIFISTTASSSTAYDRIGMIQSVNSGSSWNTIQILPEEPNSSNGESGEFMTSIAVDGSQIYISYLSSSNLNLQLLISDSYNPYTNWTNNHIEPPQGDIENGYHSSMHILDGRVYLSHSGYNEQEVYFTSETNDISAPFVTQVLDDGDVNGVNGYTAMAYNRVVPNVHFYIAYYDQSQNNRNLKFARSIDNGSIFSVDTIDNNTQVGKYPSIAVSQETIYVCYYDEANQNLKLVRSLDYGESWGTPIVVDSLGDVGKFTSLAVEGSSVYISYYDQTNRDLKFAKSIDGGNTWN